MMTFLWHIVCVGLLDGGILVAIVCVGGSPFPPCGAFLRMALLWHILDDDILVTHS